MKEEKSAEDYKEEAKKYLSQGEIDKAIECFDRAIEANPGYILAWSLKGTVLDELGRYEEAIECFDRALAVNPNIDKIWSEKGFSLLNLGKVEDAIDCFDKALEIDNREPETWNRKGIAYMNINKLKEAHDCFREALEIDPNNAEAWNGVGNVFFDMQMFEDAVECYRMSYELLPSVESLYNQGNALINLKKYEEAIEVLNKVLEVNSRKTSAWNSKGVACYELGRYDEALSCYLIAIEQYPFHNKFWNNIIELLEKLGVSEGLNEIRDAIEDGNYSLAQKTLKQLLKQLKL